MMETNTDHEMIEPTPGMTRRKALGGVALVGGAAVGGGALLAACGSDGDSPDAATGGDAAPAATATDEVALTQSGAASGLFPGGADFDAAIRAKLEGRTVKVGWTPPVLSEFFDEMEHAAFWQLAEFEQRFGVSFQWERAAPSGDFETVQEHFDIVQNWVQQGFDAIAICTAVGLEARNEIYDTALAGGTSIYEFNMPNELWADGDQRMQSSITYDNVRQSGFAAGSYIAEKLGGSGRIMQIWGPGGHWAEARQAGLDQALAANPGLEIVAKTDGGYVRDKAFDAAQNLLTSNPDVDAIYGENEEMALGASQAMDAAGLDHWDEESGEGILTIGADGLLSGFQAIREGRLTATVYVGTIEQGINVARTILYHALLGLDVDRVQNQPTAIVDKSNVDIFETYTQWALDSPKEF